MCVVTSHPFYTGKQRVVDTGGRVGAFQQPFQNSKHRIIWTCLKTRQFAGVCFIKLAPQYVELN